VAGRAIVAPARAASGEHGINLLGRSDVVRQFDPWRAVAAERCPQPEDHSASLEEHDFVVGLLGASPSERLVESSGAAEVLHAECHETDSLFHWAKYVAPLGSKPAVVATVRSAAYGLFD